MPVTQVYCWLYTKDKKIIIVSKDGVGWQFPGGHPGKKESQLQTLVREVWEETNINIKKTPSKLKFFGYYVVEKINADGKITDKYLQVRYFLYLEKS